MTAADTTASIPGVQLRQRRWDKWVLIALFCAWIAAPATIQVLGFGGPANDNRQLAPAPAWPKSLRQFTELPGQIQAYLDDRFGLRNELVFLNGLVRFALGVSSSPNVAIGRDKYLFYAYEPERLMEQHTGEDVFTPAQLKDWLDTMEANSAWLSQRGIAYYVVIAPDKSTIYPENLPDYPSLPNSTTRFDQVMNAVSARPALQIIDPRAAIKALKSQHRMYPRADSHWGPRAAFEAYTQLMARMKSRFPNAKPVTLGDYDLTKSLTRGDLANSLNLYAYLQYEEEHADFRGASHQLHVEHLPADPSSWGWPITRVHTDLPESPKVLIQGDSFTDYVLGPLFLYQTFKDPLYMHHNGTDLNKDLIEKVHPDIVIHELAERYLQPLEQ